MPLTKKVYTLKANTREDIRKNLIHLFLNENAGTGKDNECSKYDYEVENFQNYKIILKRPGLLNKGFDFMVDINGVKFKNAGNNGFHKPSHKDIMNILLQVKTTFPNDYIKVKNIINDLFSLNQPNWENISGITFKDYLGQEHPIAIILLAIKWLFIEQDITYWNWSGRYMLKNKLMDYGLL